MNYQKIRDVIVDLTSMVGPIVFVIMGLIFSIQTFGWFFSLTLFVFTVYCVVMDYKENVIEEDSKIVFFIKNGDDE